MARHNWRWIFNPDTLHSPLDIILNTQLRFTYLIKIPENCTMLSWLKTLKWREFWGQSVFPWVPWGLGVCIYKQWKSVRYCSWRLLLSRDHGYRGAINRRTSKQCHYNYLAFCDIDTIVKWRLVILRGIPAKIWWWSNRYRYYPRWC